MSGYVWNGSPEPKPLPPKKIRFTKIQCGTHSGYSYHYANGEPPCEPCRQAGIKYKRDHQARIRRQAVIEASEGTRRLLEATAEAAEWHKKRKMT